MRRAIGAVAIAAALLIPEIVVAAKPLGSGIHAFTWTDTRTVLRAVVESQSVAQQCDVTGETPCVVNPTIGGDNCLWSVDDRLEWAAAGVLSSGATEITRCIVGDTTHHLFGLTAHARNPNLGISVTFEPQGVTFTFTPVQIANNRYEYRGCVQGPIYSGDDFNPSPQVTEAVRIAGSGINGTPDGWGVPTSVTIAVSNPGAKLNDTDAVAKYGITGSLENEFCRFPMTPFFKQGGEAVWRTGL